MTYYGETLSKMADQMNTSDETFVALIEASIKVLHLALDIKREDKKDSAQKFVKGLLLL